MNCADEELRLRYACEGDYEIVFNQYYGDVKSSEYLSREVHEDVSKTIDILSKLSVQGSLEGLGKSIMVVARIKDNKPIGLITLVAGDSTVELHIGILKNERRKGLASKSLGLAEKYCIDKKWRKR